MNGVHPNSRIPEPREWKTGNTEEGRIQGPCRIPMDSRGLGKALDSPIQAGANPTNTAWLPKFLRIHLQRGGNSRATSSSSGHAVAA